MSPESSSIKNKDKCKHYLDINLIFSAVGGCLCRVNGFIIVVKYLTFNFFFPWIISMNFNSFLCEFQQMIMSHKTFYYIWTAVKQIGGEMPES